MKNSTSRTAWFRLVFVCLCFFAASSTYAAEILFQHNFENLDNPPTDAQLSSPNIIYPELTNIFLNSGLLYRTRSDGGTKALSITATSTTAVYTLLIEVPRCRTLGISSISFKGFASNDADISVEVNGQAYGGSVISPGNTYVEVKQTKKQNVSGIQNRGNQCVVQITVNSKQTGTTSSIDDLTIEGDLRIPDSKLENLKFPNKTNLAIERCAGQADIGYTANLVSPYNSITYALDNASISAGVTITSDASVSYPNAFSGKTTISATAVGCSNESLTKTFKVLTTASGPSSINLDFQTEQMIERFPNRGTLKNAKNPCFTAGFIHTSGFDYAYVYAKVRFDAGVRNFEISGAPSTRIDATPGFDLYFLQSDFDNYHGALSLPKGPFDEQGKENLRLMIRSANPVSNVPIQNIKPTVTWNEAGRWWVVSYTFSNQGLAVPWPASNFKVFLSDAAEPFVKLTSFSGTHNPEGDHLYWKTSKEVNVSRFEVENSEDTLQGFKYLATVSPSNNDLGADYNYTHMPSAAFKQFYRLKTVFSDNTFSYSKIILVRSDIIYLHKFDNLDSPPTEAQLATPDFIAAGLTSTWTANSGSLISFNRANEGKELGLETTNTLTIITLKVRVPNCKKLDIRSISLDLRTGNTKDASVDGSAVKVGNNWQTINVDYISSSRTGDVSIQITQPDNRYGGQIYIDNFTIYGTISENLVDIRTIGLGSVASRCQQGTTLDYSAINKGQYSSIQYSLDEASLAAGNQINANTGIVTFLPTFSGESTISANAISCINIPLSTSKKVVTTPGGIPYSDMDLQAKIPQAENSGSYNSNDNLKAGCYVAGSVRLDGFYGQTVTAKVRFKNEVRGYDMTIKITGNDDFTSPKMDLYFSQSDFDNYRGTLRLPRDPFDELGKANLRLRLYSERLLPYYHNGEIDVTPDLRWDDTQQYWVATLRFFIAEESGPSNAPDVFPNFKVSLANAQIPYPVKLESFSAKPSPEGNRLTWKTTEEIDFSHFEVERSEDPRQGFQYLATVSSGNNATGGSYHYTDIQNATAQQYYRLKMVDIDGSFEYSRIVNLTAQSGAEDLLVYPNPAQNLIYLDSPNAINSVKLIDQKGNAVFGKSFLEAEKSLNIQLPKLHSGAYFLKVNPGTDKQQVKKIIIR